MPEPLHSWLSVYLDMTGPVSPVQQIYGAPADQVLDRLVAPVVQHLSHEGLVSRFFFIRYRDKGPHVRLRLMVPEASHEAVVSTLEAARMEFNRTSGSPISVRGLRLEPYQRELDRYAGPRGILISEALFETSSKLVLELLPALERSQGDVELRLGHGVIGVALLVGCLLADLPAERVRGFLELYETWLLASRVSAESRPEVAERYGSLAVRQDRLLRTARTVHEGACQPYLLPHPFDEAACGFMATRAAVCEVWREPGFRINGHTPRSVSDALEFLTSSYLHMHLNRLGIPPVHEALLCRIVRQSLEPTPTPVSS